MLARYNCYRLKSGPALNVNITVHPCCTVEIDIPEMHQNVQREVDDLHFKLTKEGMLLVCNESDGRDMQLHLSRKDALGLCQMIDEVIEEHEELMSDLC